MVIIGPTVDFKISFDNDFGFNIKWQSNADFVNFGKLKDMKKKNLQQIVTLQLTLKYPNWETAKNITLQRTKVKTWDNIVHQYFGSVSSKYI